jgi:type III secretion protein Q
MTHDGAAGVTAWQPLRLPQIDQLLADGLNALYKRRPPARVPFAGRELVFEAAWLPRRPDIPDAVTLTAALGKEKAYLVVPQAVIDALFTQFASDIVQDALTPAQKAMLIEYALSGALEKIETALMSPIAIASADSGMSAIGSQRAVELIFRIEIEGVVSSWCLLRIPYNHLLRLGQLLDRLPKKAPPSQSHIDFPLDVHVRMASADLSLAELQSLAPGDIVLVDHHCREPETALAVFGGHLAAPVKILPGGYQLADALKPAKTAGLAWGVNDYPVQRGPLAEGARSNVPVRVFFELARFELSLAKLLSMARGAMLDALPSREGGSLDVVVDGARICKGEFTTIGAGLGVRILR